MDCRIASPWEPAQLDKKPEELHGLPQEPQGPAGAHLCHQVTTGRWMGGHKDKKINPYDIRRISRDGVWNLFPRFFRNMIHMKKRNMYICQKEVLSFFLNHHAYAY